MSRYIAGMSYSKSILGLHMEIQLQFHNVQAEQGCTPTWQFMKSKIFPCPSRGEFLEAAGRGRALGSLGIQRWMLQSGLFRPHLWPARCGAHLSPMTLWPATRHHSKTPPVFWKRVQEGKGYPCHKPSQQPFGG